MNGCSLGDDGTGQVTVPAGATFLSVQGTYDRSMDIYINCDAGMEKDTRTLHWYSISDILNSGVTAPNECYKGKYEDSARAAAKPGEFIFYVRKTNLARIAHGLILAARTSIPGRISFIAQVERPTRA